MTGEPAPDLRPAGAYLHSGPCVVVPPAVAAWLLSATNLATLRVASRGEDPQRDAVLIALTHCANLWRTSTTSAATSAGGSAPVVEAEVAPPLEPMTTSRAADVLGITDRGVRLACNQGRIPATRVDGRWQLHPAGVAAYRRTRMGI
jgi:hypothetical protein